MKGNKVFVHVRVGSHEYKPTSITSLDLNEVKRYLRRKNESGKLKRLILALWNYAKSLEEENERLKRAIENEN